MHATNCSLASVAANIWLLRAKLTVKESNGGEEKMERRTANGEMYPRSDDNVECNATTLRSEKSCLAQT